MNIRIVCLALALASPAFTQEPNPFVKKPADKKTEQPPGPSVFGVLEHILVPPAAIDAWIEANGMPDDATPLREELEKWVREGSARIDHTTFFNTLIGRKASSGSILEQLYPTEYMSGGADVWPLPTAFEARNTGYFCAFEAKSLQGGIAFVAESGWTVTREQHPSWHPLMERTRQPGDIFIPIFDTIQSSSLDSIRVAGGPGDPFAANPGKEADPQAWEKGALPLAPSKTHWLGRFDPVPMEREQGAMSRLVFFRGATGETTEPPLRDTVPERFHFSFKAVRVKHADFSAWLREAPLHTIAMDCWEQTAAWEKDGRTETVDSAGGVVNLSHRWDFQSVRETIYPTEWTPINETTELERWEKITPAKEGGQTVHRNNTYARKRIEAVPGLGGASVPSSFETRHVGLLLNAARFSSDAGEAIAELRLSRVRQVSLSTYRRIEVDGEWIPDIQLPLFSDNSYEATCRLLPGRWILATSCVEYLNDGTPDRDHRILYFVRME